MKSFLFYKQLDSMDSSPTCLRMIAEYYGKVTHYHFKERNAISIKRELV